LLGVPWFGEAASTKPWSHLRPNTGPRQHQGATAQSLHLFAVFSGVIMEEPSHYL
jgi:hypothetical protein